MRAVDIIRKKRDGEALTAGEIAAMVSGSSTGEVADYQWAAPPDGDPVARHERRRDGSAHRRDDSLRPDH